MPPLIEVLDSLTSPGSLVQAEADSDVRCTACANRCLIHPGKRGICQVRFNKDGILRVPWGYVAGLNLDPVEKKPFNHLLPGADALTFGMLGCDFHCDFCQNWLSSQALRDPHAITDPRHIRRISPEQIIQYAIRGGAQVIVSSYNEPLITTEWSVDIFKMAKQTGLMTAYVSNGNATPDALAFLRPWLDAYKIDLKCMQDKSYRQLGGVLINVLDTIQEAHNLGLWVEVVTLIIPGFNDSPQELWDAARYLVSVSPDIPWHVTAFHPDYKRVDVQSTNNHQLQEASEIGQEAGLNYVYAGNLPGRVGSLEDTFCPTCLKPLVRRRGYTLLEYHLTAQGCCPYCNSHIPGIWSEHPEQINLGGWGFHRQVI